ncbi:MAG TPA: transglutaminase family protein [Ilumatobacteraceae bacterium]
MDPAGEPAPVDAAIERFAQLFSTAHVQPPLDEAALGISAVLQPALDVASELAEIDAIAGSCPDSTREGVVEHLFGQLGFTGDPRTYGDWHNSCLDHVLASRRGIPITLSVLTVEVARRLGVALCGVGMPAHFVVGDPADPNWFVDAFDHGTVLDRNGCRELLQRVTSGQVTWRESHLDPTPPRAILVRMLNNLRAGFTQRPDPVRLALVMRLRMSIAELSDEWREAVRALAVLN